MNKNSNYKIYNNYNKSYSVMSASTSSTKYNNNFSPKINKNLVYKTAEDWAKQNFDDLCKMVFLWIWPNETDLENKQYKLIFKKIHDFQYQLFNMNEMYESTDIERMEKLISILNSIALDLKTKVPEEIIERLKSIFWSA